MNTHIVVAGDTLSKLALKYYGDLKAWPEIATANRITDPNKIQVGMKLTIPDRSPIGVPNGEKTIDVTRTPEGIEEVSVTARKKDTLGLWILGATLGILWFLTRR